MGRINYLTAIVLMAVSVVSAEKACGQIVYGQPASARIRAIYTSWETSSEGEDVSLDQFYVPFLGFIPLKDNLEARIFLGGATNKLTGGGEDRNLNGLTDTRIQVNRSFSDDRLVLSLGVNLPTGKKKLDFEEEWFVTNFLAHDYLTYPVRRLGGGLGVNAMLGGATMAGEYRLGGSVLYHYTGTYEAYEDNGDYNPGDFFSLNAGFSRPFDQFFWIGDITFTSYTDDQQDDLAIYNRGDQLQFRMGGTWEGSTRQASLDARYFVRDRNAVYDLAGAILNQLKIYGNEFSVLGHISWFLDQKKLKIGPLFHYRAIAANEYELGSAENIGFGIQADRQLSTRYELGLSAEYFTGNANGGDIDLSGFQVATSLSAVF